MLDFDKLLEDASLPEEVVPICLDGRLARRYEEVKARVDARAAQTAEPADGDARLASRRGVKADPERAELDRLTNDLQARTVPFLLKAMSRDQFVEMLADPRFAARTDAKGNPDGRDARMGLNTSTFIPALIRAAVAEPDLSDDARWEKLRQVLTSAQIDKLFGTAWDLNREDREVPFSPGGSPSPQS